MTALPDSTQLLEGQLTRSRTNVQDAIAISYLRATQDPISDG
jgi:hypothetical protein